MLTVLVVKPGDKNPPMKTFFPLALNVPADKDKIEVGNPTRSSNKVTLLPVQTILILPTVCPLLCSVTGVKVFTKFRVGPLFAENAFMVVPIFKLPFILMTPVRALVRVPLNPVKFKLAQFAITSTLTVAFPLSVSKNTLSVEVGTPVLPVPPELVAQ